MVDYIEACQLGLLLLTEFSITDPTSGCAMLD